MRPPLHKRFGLGVSQVQRWMFSNTNRCQRILHCGTLDNLLITPHTAGLTERLWHPHYARFSGNLRRYLAREPLQYAVDKHKGY